MEHKQFESENGIIHYWINKSDNPNAQSILFSHGVCVNHETFNYQVEYFSKKCNLITYDMPFHGLSQSYFIFSYKNIAKDLNSILEIENIQNVILVGMSAGGYTSQKFAIMYPEKVCGLISIDSTPFGLDYYSKIDKYLIRKISDISSYLPDKCIRQLMAKSACKTKSGYKLTLKMFKESSKDMILKQMSYGYKCFLKENEDCDFKFPVLILLGEYDNIGKVKIYCDYWAHSVGYPIHIIEDAGHCSNIDNPESVNAEIEAFLYEI